MQKDKVEYCDEYPISSPQTPVYLRRSYPENSPGDSPQTESSPIPRRISYGNNSESPMTSRRLLRELSSNEKKIRSWIEDALEVEFKDRPDTVHKSATKKMKEESNAFYHNLESGVILCKLLEKFFPSTIDYSKVHEFNERMYFISNNEDKNKTTNYLSNARANVQLFLDGVRRIDGFPVLAFFSFEDLFLQQNKQSIISCLTNLHEFVARSISEEEEQIMTPTDEELINLEMTNRPVLDRPITFDKAFGKSVDFDASVLEEVEGELSPSIESTPPLEKKKPTIESASNALVSVFTLPFVVLFLVLSGLWNVYQQHTTKAQK
ncbi:hypothetical protein AKO1_007808 [Acrasis kona]|uniref:Calponin-homology (CH) domain-containing protein n=1 Tax=Acrasis kona TaxID=1008807 RepID=A0AAW2YPN5_9EUKA